MFNYRYGKSRFTDKARYRNLLTTIFVVVLSIQTVRTFAASPTAKDKAGQQGATVTWISSTAEQPWQQMPEPIVGPGNPDTPMQVRVERGTTYQTIDGFGGCFNELGWVALQNASAPGREKVLSALFGDDGCAFNLGRIPIGSSDYALSAYSLDDTPGDMDLAEFSIERDKKDLIRMALS